MGTGHATGWEKSPAKPEEIASCVGAQEMMARGDTELSAKALPDALVGRPPLTEGVTRSVTFTLLAEAADVANVTAPR